MPSNGCLKKTVLTLIHPIDTFDPSWTKSQLEKWIDHAKGRAISKFTANTTHVVCTEKAYRQQFGEVRAAIAARKKGERLHIVSPEWLAQTLSQQKRAKEGEFSWETRLEKVGRKGRGRGRKKQVSSDTEVESGDEEEGVAVKGPKTASGLLAEAFQEHTEQFVSEGERRALREVMDREREVKRQAVLAEEKERREKVEQEAVFRKGAKKARNEIFSDNHHIYMDATEFKYDIVMTKVDTRLNRNERYALTIYESNSKPHTYATNLHYAGTGIQPSNNVIAALGCSFPTAFHAFRKVFKEKTKVEWDERISYMTEIAEKRRKARAEGVGEAEGSVKGRAVSEAEVAGGGGFGFARQGFVYHLPLYGPRGLLPEKPRVVGWPPGPAIPLPTASTKGKGKEGVKGAEEVELWMSGSNGIEGPSGGEFSVGPVAEPTSNGMSDWDAFMSGQFRTDAQAAADGEAAALALLPEDVGPVEYPFGAGDARSLGEGTVEDDGMFGVEMGGRQGSDHDEDVADADGQEEVVDAAGIPVSSSNQQPATPETVAETQNFGATQLALDAAAGLEAFMKDLHDTPSEDSSPSGRPADTGEDKAPSDTPTGMDQAMDLGTSVSGEKAPAVDLGRSILGKRKGSPIRLEAEAGAEAGTGIEAGHEAEGEAGNQAGNEAHVGDGAEGETEAVAETFPEVEREAEAEAEADVEMEAGEENPKYHRLTSPVGEQEQEQEQEEEEEDFAEFHDALPGDEMMVDGEGDGADEFGTGAIGADAGAGISPGEDGSGYEVPRAMTAEAEEGKEGEEMGVGAADEASTTFVEGTQMEGLGMDVEVPATAETEMPDVKVAA